MKLWENVKAVMNRMLRREAIAKAAGVDLAVSEEMTRAVGLWGSMYENKAPWRNQNTQSLNLAAAIASELARMVTLEMKWDVTGNSRAAFLKEQVTPVFRDLRRYVEYGCAKGGMVFKPYAIEKGIAISYIQNDGFFPTAYDSQGNITGAVFTEQKTLGDKCYTKVEKHWMDNGGVHIENKAYESRNDDELGKEIALTVVPKWAGLDAYGFIPNRTKPLFAYFKVPQANTVDSNSPLGVSVYARAVDAIRHADEQYSRILWEYEAGEMAIDADVALFRRDANGAMQLPKGKERLFRVLDGLNDGSGNIEAWTPKLRDVSYFRGLNELFMRIEDLCGLARGTFSDPSGEAKTATELNILKQRSYATVTDIQMALQGALEDLLECMDTLTTVYSLNDGSGYETSFRWDDSIIVDAETERARDLQEIRDGILQKWEYRVKWFGEDEKTARVMIQQQQDNDSLMGFGGDG